MRELGASDDEDEPASSGAILRRPSSARLRTTVLPGSAPGAQARFRNIALLGDGRVGEVALVEDQDLGRSVVVKRLRWGRRDADQLLAFADEARLVAQLEHPGIQPLYDVGVDEDGQHYLVVKRLSGETLANVIAKLRDGEQAYLARFGLSDRLRIFTSIAEAMSYAHSKGVIHRDLRPDNVVIGAHGEVTITDFGVAKRIGAGDRAELRATLGDRLVHTRLGDLVGTPRYMSPEQAAGRNDELDARSDIFSLGLVLAELALIEHPLSSKLHHSEILAELVTRGVDFAELRARSAEAGLPVELRSVLFRALEHDRRRRYQSVDQLLSDLRRIQRGDLAVSCHVTLLKRSTYELLRWVDRHPRAYTLLFAAAALAVLGGVGWGVGTLFSR